VLSSPVVVASGKGPYPCCEGQMHSLQYETLRICYEGRVYLADMLRDLSSAGSTSVQGGFNQMCQVTSEVLPSITI